LTPAGAALDVGAEAAGAPLGRGAAWYLRPEAEVVAFVPRPELSTLREWCVTGGRLAVRLVIGKGGVGKTRLAVQLVQDLAENGWRAVWVAPGQEGNVINAVREVGEPAVLVVDYAETRSGLAGLLADWVAAEDSPDMRVVLLARTVGEWWHQLLNRADYRLSQVLGDTTPITLGPLTDESGQDELFADALTAFADRLQVACPDARLVVSDPEAVVLVVHAAALLAVLDHATMVGASRRPYATADALTGLLGHEARYWHKSAISRGLILDPSVERLAVAIGCLIGANSEADAAELLLHVPDFADSAERRGQVARWLHDLYPGTGGPAFSEDGEWIGSLRSDRVAEHFVTAELSVRPGLLSGLLVGLSEHRILKGVTVLARAAISDSRALGLLRHAFGTDLEHLAVPGLRTPDIGRSFMQGLGVI
jgi:hypothetical protein